MVGNVHGMSVCLDREAARCDEAAEVSQLLICLPLLSCLALSESPSELCALGRNPATSKACEWLPPGCTMKQMRRGRQLCFLASRKDRAENLGMEGKHCLRSLGGLVMSWEETELETESRGF